MKKVLYDLPSKIGVTENIYIPLQDGTRLAARVWLPTDARGTVGGRLPLEVATTNPTAPERGCGGYEGDASALMAHACSGPNAAASGRYPAILEYIPYRKRNGTRTRDEPMHGFFSANGYACVRVDMRGSGESDGIYEDEYLKQEQDDALEVIAWIAAQPWCTGDVGMMGKSWGGFNSLQVAARQPPALRAIVIVGFTDNRFKDDIHWKGGCLLNDNMWWGSLMQAFIAQPPDPEIVGQDRWKEQWLRRLESMPFNAATWASHQHYDAYWRHGSVCEDYGSIQVPVLMFDGWADSYTNPVFTLLERLTVPCRAVVGPWVHAYPHDGTPTPPMNFLREAVDWWDHWMKGKTDNGAMRAPKLQAYVEDHQLPNSQKLHCPGAWYGAASWPSQSIAEAPCRLLASRALVIPAEAGGGGVGAAGPTSGQEGGFVLVHTPLNHGLLSGEWMGAGVPGETAADQRIDNGMAVTFTSAPLAREVVLLGRPTLTVKLTCDQPKGFLFAQLCAVDACGAATRVSYGLQNLVHTGPNGDAEIALMVPNTGTREVRVALDFCGYRVPAGHRIVLSLANNYWPMVWPSPRNTTLMLDLGSAELRLPVMTESAARSPISGPDATPEAHPPTPVTVLTEGRVDRSVSYDIVNDTWTCVTDGVGGVFGEGIYRFDDIDTTLEHNLRRELTLSNRDPLSASYTITQKFKMSRPGWNTETDIVSSQTSDENFLHMRSHMVSYAEGEKVFEKNFYQRIPREAI